MSTTSRKIGMLAVAAAAAAVGLALGGLFTSGGGAVAQETGRGEGGRGARYTVVATEASNLIVTDNRTNLLHFYTIDEGAEIGSDLKLRGSIDLSKVGGPVLTPQKTQGEAGGSTVGLQR